MKIFDIFPTPVWLTQLPPEQAARINGQAIDLVERLRGDTAGIARGDRWQTANNLEDRPELAELMGLVMTSAGEALDSLRVQHNGYLVTGCWANIKPEGAGHRPHIHPNNYLSGVYYVRTPRQGGRIVFHDPRVQPTLMAPRVSAENQYNCPRANLPVQAGMLILFPAWLTHSVEENQEDLDRISIAFNIMFKNYGEEIARPRWEFQPGETA